MNLDDEKWSNHDWKLVKWNQIMRFHTFNRIVTHLDEKIEINQKKFRISFFLPFSLRATLKRSVES